MSGAGAGACQIIITTPMELLKIQLQDAGRTGHFLFIYLLLITSKGKPLARSHNEKYEEQQKSSSKATTKKNKQNQMS